MNFFHLFGRTFRSRPRFIILLLFAILVFARGIEYGQFKSLIIDFISVRAFLRSSCASLFLLSKGYSKANQSNCTYILSNNIAYSEFFII